MNTYKNYDVEGNKLCWQEWGKRYKRDMKDLDVDEWFKYIYDFD